MKSFSDFVNSTLNALSEARDIAKKSKQIQVKQSSQDKEENQCAIMISPHPDDECLNGALARRFQIEGGLKIVNIAITLGSIKLRRISRLEELKSACSLLGWSNIVCNFESINAETRKNNPEYWRSCTRTLAKIIKDISPVAIFSPHIRDWNKTHIGTALLAHDALELYPDFYGYLIDTEYWGAMENANLLAQVDKQTAADLISAISMHRGEVERSDYNIRLPAYFIDNVRRGGEIVGGMGNRPPHFDMGCIYNVSIKSKESIWISAFGEGVFLESGTSALEKNFPLIF